LPGRHGPAYNPATGALPPAELESAMSYMLLIVEPVGQRAERTEAQGRQAYTEMVDYAQSLRARGKLADARSLSATDDSVRIQAREGRATLRDGPYAEVKEMIGGFFLLQDVTRDEAIAIARDCPAAQWCTVEVRRLAPCFE